MTPMQGASLEIAGLEVHYGPVMAVRGATIRVPPSGVVALLGANGAGKSTLLKAAAGLLDPTRGTVALDGAPIAGLDPDAVVARGLSLVPEGREVFPFRTVIENLMLGGYTRSKAERLAGIEKAFGYFPALRPLRDRPAGLLSGGEQQMVAIGRSLVARPRIMLLDEPSLGLSPLLSAFIFDILRRIRDEERLSILVVEQNARLALGLADHAYVLENGRIVAEDDARAMADKSDIREFYLGGASDGIRGERRWKRRKTWR